MASSNLEIDNGVVKEYLNCVKCKSVPQDICLVPCGCRLCCICINDLLTSGVEFCPGSSEECGRSSLSQSLTDYRTKMKVLKSPTKCPNHGCVHACQLTNMEEHLRVCPKKSVECLFCEFGCTQDKLAAEEMSDHLQRESLSLSEILIRMINNIINKMEGSTREIDILKKTDENNKRHFDVLKNADESKTREIEMLKKADESKSREIGMLKNADESKSREIEILKKGDESKSREIEMLKKADESKSREIELLKKADESKSREIGMLKNADESKNREIGMLKNADESKSREIDILKKADESKNREIGMLKNADESKSREIGILKSADESKNREIGMLKKSNEDNKKEIEMLKKHYESNIRNVELLNKTVQSYKDTEEQVEALKKKDESNSREIEVLKKLIESVDQKVNTFKNIQPTNKKKQLKNAVNTTLKSQIQGPVNLVDGKFVWPIHGHTREVSSRFRGVLHPYNYQLASRTNMDKSLRIFLRLNPADKDKNLHCPFLGTVSISVGNPGNPTSVLTVTRQIRMKIPINNSNSSAAFQFLFSELNKAGLNFSCGLQVTCSISHS